MAGESAFDRLMQVTNERLKSAATDTAAAVSRGAKPIDVKPPEKAEHRRVGALSEEAIALINEADPDESPSWGTRFLAGIKATPEGRLNFLRKKFGEDKVLPVYDSAGEIHNVVIKRDGKKPILLDPRGLDWGDVADESGSAIEAAGGLLGAAVAARAGKGRGASALIEAAGDLAGTAARQGASALLPGDDEMSALERAQAAGVNIGAGQIGNLMQGTAALTADFTPTAIGGGGVTPGARAASRMSREMAKEAEQESAHSVLGETNKEFTERSQSIQNAFNRTLKEGGKEPAFRFMAHQASGSPSAVKLWRTLQQPASEFADRAATEEMRQLKTIAEIASMTVDRMVKDPDMLDNLSVAEQLGNMHRRALEKAHAARESTAAPLYERAAKMSGGEKIFDMGPAVSVVRGIQESEPGTAAAKYVTRQLRNFKINPDAPLVDYAHVKSMRAHFTAVARGDQTIPGASERASRRVGSMVVDGIDRAMDESAKTAPIAAEARSALVEANRTYREMSKPINDLQTPPFMAIVNGLAQKKGDTVVGTLMGMSEGNLRAIAHQASKTPEGKEAVAGLYAQGMRSIFEKAGFGSAEPAGAKLLKQRPSAAKALSGAIKHAKQLNVLLDAMPAEHREATKTLLEGLDRIAADPKFSGSPTFGYLTSNAMFNLIKGSKSVELLAKAKDLIGEAAEVKSMTPEIMFQLVARPEGAEAYAGFVKAIAEPNKAGKAAKRAAREAVRYLSQIVMLSQRDGLLTTQGEAENE